MWHSYNFMQLQYKSLLNLPKNLGKRTQTAKNTYNWLFLLRLNNLLCWFWSWKKTKAIMYASIKQTLLIFMKYSMICAWNCPKFWGNWLQQPKILTTSHFWYCLSTPSCQPRSQYKLKTIGHAITCDTHIISCNYNISYSLACPKTWGERIQTSKNT